MENAAFLPAPIADVTVSGPVKTSPPANTPACLVIPASSATRRLFSNSSSNPWNSTS